MKPLNADEKEHLINEFRACLESWDENTDTNANDRNSVDLYTLLSEMAALKNEVRLESRQFKSTLEELRYFGDRLKEQNIRLTQDLERVREQLVTVEQKTERALLLEMLDIRDRLQAGVTAGALRQTSPLARFFSSETRFAQSLSQGLTLTLQRLDDVLANHQVRPITAIGQPLDPHLMKAVGIQSVPGKPDGLVLSETRRGYFHNSELLRITEVIVNKKES